MKKPVTTSDTTSVTKITGFLASLRGSSLRSASTAAGPMIFGSNNPRAFTFGHGGAPIE